MTNEQDLIGTAIGGTYHILRLIGEGGMARVYEATNLSTGQQVALKLLHQRHVTSNKAFARFQREARIVSSVESANIAKLFGTGMTSTGVPFIVMEHLVGQTLKQAINKQGQLPLDRVARIMVQVLCALQAAHDAHIVHRDLKPQNIFLTDDGECEDFVKLLDFGVSKLEPHDDEELSPLTDTGAVVGTASYMSPEQAVGAKSVSSRSDIYSMGVILYQMVTGRLPFEAPNNNALLLKILIEDPPDPRDLNPHIPGEMTELIKIAMDRNPAMRFQQCTEFRARLMPFVSAAVGRVEQPLQAEPTSANRQVKHVYDAIFVRLWPSSVDVTLEDGNVLKILPLDDEEDLPRVLQDFFPRGIVSSVTIDPQALLSQFPSFRSPIVLIDLQETHGELAIHEWSHEQHGYTVRHAPITDLDSEVNAFCNQRNSRGFAPGDLEHIGFNNNVDCENGTFHIATEIISRDTLQISTKIWSGGRVVDAVVQIFNPSGGDVVVQASKLAETQHSASVEEVLRGKYS